MKSTPTRLGTTSTRWCKLRGAKRTLRVDHRSGIKQVMAFRTNSRVYIGIEVEMFVLWGNEENLPVTFFAKCSESPLLIRNFTSRTTVRLVESKIRRTCVGHGPASIRTWVHGLGIGERRVASYLPDQNPKIPCLDWKFHLTYHCAIDTSQSKAHNQFIRVVNLPSQVQFTLEYMVLRRERGDRQLARYFH